jgi:hypothetical protein
MPHRQKLCDYHRVVIANLAERDHITDPESHRVAWELIRQCCCRRLP